MVKREILLAGKLPLTRERAAKVVNAASAYPCAVFLEYDAHRINGKSMLGLLSIAADASREMALITQGEGEEAAADVLAGLLRSGE